MQKIAIIGANEFQNPLILKAKEMGFETHVFAWEAGDIGERTADVFHPISIIEKDRILDECRKICPSAVVTIASDLAAVTVQYVAKNLGLTCNSDRCREVSTNKGEMRTAFEKHGVPVPGFRSVGPDDDLSFLDTFAFPIIVKPTDRSGSRSITKLETPDGVSEAVACAVRDSFENRAIIEEYIEGDEYSCESISHDGQHHFLAITKKYTTGAPHFIETAQLEPAGFDPEMERRIVSVIFNALDALEITEGASHSEFKVDSDGNIRIIEIGARMGGDCIGSDLEMLSTGYDFVKMVIEVALGLAPSFTKVCDPSAAAIRFIFDGADIEHLNELEKNDRECIWRKSEIEDPGDHPVTDSSSRHGFYIIRKKTAAEAAEMIGYTL